MITKTLISGGTVWQITGPGFYATTQKDANNVRFLTRLSYVPNAQFPYDANEEVWISDVATILGTIGIDYTSTPERECELFIRMLYGIGVNLDNLSTTFALETDMQSEGVLAPVPQMGTNFYSSMSVFDFMAMTKAVAYPYNRLVVGEPRPLVSDVENLDNGLMFNVIRKLGIWGYAVNIYSEYGITLQELADFLPEWLPTQGQRGAYVYGYVYNHLRTKGFPILTQTEIDTLIG